MTDQVYFIGYRPEQFTGWDGTGSPSYTGVAASNTYETNNLGSIGLSTSGNVIWKDLDITDTSKPVYIMVELWSSSNDIGNIFLTDGNNLVSIVPYGSSYAYCNVSTGTYSSSGRINITNTLYDSNYSETFINTTKLYIKLSSTNSGFDTISVDLIQKGSTEEYTIYSGSITPLSSLKSIFSCYYEFKTNNTYYGYFFYCVVANFDLTGAYIDYTQVFAEATYTGWTGNVSTLTNYPLVTNNSANGLYSFNPGDQVTFTSAKSLTTGDGYTTPKCTFIDTTLMSSDNSLGFQAVPIIKDPSSSTTYTMGSDVTPTTTPKDYQWISYRNPSNLSDWSVSDVNKIEFGLKRTK